MEYYDQKTDTFLSYDKATEIIQKRCAIVFDYTATEEEMTEQFKVIDILLENYFEPIKKQPREYEKDGVLIADYT